MSMRLYGTNSFWLDQLPPSCDLLPRRNGEKVNIARVRELGTKIQNESRQPGPTISDDMPCGSEFTVDPEIP